MAKGKSRQLSHLKIAALLSIALFLPIFVYVAKAQTRTESDASAYCKANIYVSPNKRQVEFDQTGYVSTYDVYVTQTKNHACKYNLDITTPTGVGYSIQKQITPNANSTKRATLKVWHTKAVKPGWKDIYIKVTRVYEDPVPVDAVGHATYIVNDPHRGGDN